MTKLTFKDKTVIEPDFFNHIHKTKKDEYKALPIEEKKAILDKFAKFAPSEKEAFKRENKDLVKLQLKNPNLDITTDYTECTYRPITARNFDTIERLSKEADNPRLTEKQKENLYIQIERAKTGILLNQTGKNDKSYEKTVDFVEKTEKFTETMDKVQQVGNKMTRKGVKLTAMVWTPLPYVGYSVIKSAHKGKKQEEIKIVPETNNNESELVGMVKAIDTALNNGTIEKEQAKEILNDYINNKY